MRTDARDAATIGFVSMGFLFGALVRDAIGNGNVILWCGGGTVLDSAFSVYIVSREIESTIRSFPDEFR